MRITLAGYNLDADTIELIKLIVDNHRQGADPSLVSDLLDKLIDEPLTPETISAAYARISRSEKNVHELRRDARSSVNRARQSNERIVFGLGHASVAEHAVFNLDVTDASRLALEELEGHRLASYTESSQRYISMSGDFIIPQEIKEIGRGELFEVHCRKLFEGYRYLAERLENFHQDLPERDRQGRAREDARYLLPLACRGQVGMTLNARNAEWIIQQSAHSTLVEVREIGIQMNKLLKSLTPSLIKYTDASPFWRESNEEIARAFQGSEEFIPEKENEVTLLSGPVDSEKILIAAMGLRQTGIQWASLLGQSDSMSASQKKNLIARAHKYLTIHSPARRELELASFTFSIVLSASAFAQLKRHRISTIIPQSYDPALGVTIPPAIIDAELETSFLDYARIASEAYAGLVEALPDEQTLSAQYVLTNAHRRRVIFHANAREMIHFSRLREDAHAQWDIRQLAGQMVTLAKNSCPVLMFLAGGKDSFQSVREEIESRA